MTPRLGLAGGGASMIVVIAMIGILAAIAIPAYQDYTLRTQVMQAMPVADQVQAAAQPYLEEHRQYPDAPEDIGLPAALDAGPVSAIGIVDGGIELTLRSDNAALDGRTIVLSAFEYDDGTIGWDCTGGSVEARHRPPHCRPGP
jgi:type IV pilus assembly protein PilA